MIDADPLLALNPAMFDHGLAELDVIERKRQYRNDPVLWAKDILGVRLWSKQREIAYAVRDNHNVAVAAGHGGGKSHLASVLMAWWADVHPIKQVKILSTAPTFSQTSILWDNLRNWHTIARKRYQEYVKRRGLGLPLEEFKYNDHPLPGTISADNVWKAENGVRIGFGRKPPDNLLDSAFQGEHAPFLLAIGDEGAGLPAELVDALGNNASGSANRVLLIANPTNPNSRMADYWKSKNPNWVTMNISVRDFPTVTHEPGFDAEELERLGMSGQGYIDDRAADWGEDNPQFIARVEGRWSFDAGNNVFTDQELARAVDTVVLPDPEARPRDGWDIARQGNDLSVGYRCLEGEVWTVDDEGNPLERTGRRGYQVRRIDSWGKAPITGHNPENLGTATRIDRHALDAASSLLVIDASGGYGGGVVDGLRELGFGAGKYQVLEYYGAGSTTDRRSFVNARAEHFFALKAMMHRGEIDLDPQDERLLDELRGIVFEYADNGARKIESKDSMKRRGAKSPDFADALVYATADLSPLLDPLQQLSRGDKVFVDPWSMLQMSRDAAGMPL